jgi:hypothetical protein
LSVRRRFKTLSARLHAIGNVLTVCRFQAVLVLDRGVKTLAFALGGVGIRLPRRLLVRLACHGLAAWLMPASLALAARGRTVVLVSGTNGKTTTTALLTRALGGAVATNAGNHNFYCGLLDALLRSNAPMAVLEVDELWLPEVLRWLVPELLVILNLHEDAWLRTPDPQYVLDRWKTLNLGAGTALLAWADDPALVSLLSNRPVQWLTQQENDAKGQTTLQACPTCGEILRRSGWHWSCRCDLRHPVHRLGPQATWQLSPCGTTLHPPTGRRPEVAVNPGLSGRINRRNAAFALAGAMLLGRDPEPVQHQLQTLAQLPLRDQVYRLAGRDVRLLLGKNPSAWIANLDRLGTGGPVMLLQQQSTATLDLSWLYDIPVETLAGRQVGICGAHALDLAVWLTYAGVDFIAAADPRALVGQMAPGELLCVSDLLGAYLIEALAD